MRINYVRSRDIPVGYKPTLHSSRAKLGRILDRNGLVNQSDIKLTGPQIEVCVIGYNFILNTPITPARRERDFDIAFSRYSNQIDREIMFNYARDSERKSFSSYLSGKLESAWRPRAGLWREDPEINDLIKGFRSLEPLNPERQDDIIREALDRYLRKSS